MQAQGGGEGSAGSAYRGLRSRRSASMLGEINVTPLVDVVLVLLLVFMVTAPMMSRGIDVSLPVADQPKVFAIADEDLERENAEKTSSVHFLRFELDPTSIAAARVGTPIRMGIDLDAYRVEPMTLAENTRAALILDLA